MYKKQKFNQTSYVNNQQNEQIDLLLTYGNYLQDDNDIQNEKEDNQITNQQDYKIKKTKKIKKEKTKDIIEFKGANQFLNKWLQKSAFGQPIPNINIVCFKCPMKQKYNDILQKNQRLSVDQLFGHYNHNIQITLIIDLNFTDKYYDVQVLESIDVNYMKFKIPGKQIPSDEQLNMIFDQFDNIKKQNIENQTDFYVGVHCTHGINRTGFVVCSYLIQRVGMPPDEAIDMFQKTRGEVIENELYIQKLKEMKDNQQIIQ